MHTKFYISWELNLKGNNVYFDQNKKEKEINVPLKF